MSRCAAPLAIAVLLLTGCSNSTSKHPPAPSTNRTTTSTGTSSTIPTKRDLAAAALNVTDLPTGWSSQPASPTTTSLCNEGLIDAAVPSEAKAKVQFVYGTEAPVFSEELLSYTDGATAGRAIDTLQREASACTSYKADSALVTIGRLSIPRLGQRSVGYRLTILQDGQTAVGDAQVIQQRNVIEYVAFIDVAPDTQQLATFAKLAFDKATRTLHVS